MSRLNLASLTSSEKRELLTLLEEKERRKRRRKLFDMYPESGALRRELYPKHVQFFAGGQEHLERCMMAANRVGKTWGVGAYETTVHLTGLYPDWWNGRRFERPISAWVAGDTRTTTRDIVQNALLGVGGEGGAGELGTGMVPGDHIVGKPTPMQGVPGGVDTVLVKHKLGGNSVLQFKSYDQGRRTFQGTKKDLCWFDEEPPMEVYEEGLLRLTATAPGEENGLMLCTFTPLLGLSKVALKFLPDLAPDA
jgi:phage terminase large subunit-like protein